MKTYNKHIRNIKLSNITSLLVFILVFSLTLCMISGGGYPLFNDSAEALTSTSSAVKAGGGAELWSGTSFNSDVLNDIYDKLFGGNNAVEYIKTNGTEEYNVTGSYVIPASVINSKVGSDSGLVVKLDGKDWMVTSLTLATLNGTENVVLTLYLANGIGETQFWNDNSNTKGNSMYSRSIVRNHILKNETWSLFNTTGDGTFANKFLVQPKNINYQQTQMCTNRANATYAYLYPNEALLTQSSGWHSSINYQSSDTFADPDGKLVRYDAWGDDYIWLPSGTETGWTDSGSSGCIWRLSDAQRISQSQCWLRSGHPNSYFGAFTLLTTGAYDAYSYVGYTRTVRPAIHLNLTAAGLGVTLDNPENVPTTYNGDVQTIKSVVDANPTAFPWYKAEYYEHTSNYVSLTYQDSQGTDVANVKNAGEYWVKAEITDNWINAVNAAVDAEGAQNGWTATQIAEEKVRRKPKFKGDPVTESGHVESDTVRWFKFIVSPKELIVNKPS